MIIKNLLFISLLFISLFFNIFLSKDSQTKQHFTDNQSNEITEKPFTDNQSNEITEKSFTDNQSNEILLKKPIKKHSLLKNACEILICFSCLVSGVLKSSQAHSDFHNRRSNNGYHWYLCHWFLCY